MFFCKLLTDWNCILRLPCSVLSAISHNSYISVYHTFIVSYFLNLISSSASVSNPSTDLSKLNNLNENCQSGTMTKCVVTNVVNSIH